MEQVYKMKKHVLQKSKFFHVIVIKVLTQVQDNYMHFIFIIKIFCNGLLIKTRAIWA